MYTDIHLPAQGLPQVPKAALFPTCGPGFSILEPYNDGHQSGFCTHTCIHGMLPSIFSPFLLPHSIPLKNSPIPWLSVLLLPSLSLLTKDELSYLVHKCWSGADGRSFQHRGLPKLLTPRGMWRQSLAKRHWKEKCSWKSPNNHIHIC